MEFEICLSQENWSHITETSIFGQSSSYSKLEQVFFNVFGLGF